MPETNEKAWGAVKGSNQLVDATDVPTVKRAATASVRLEDLDFDLLELGAEVKKGSAGDSFLELKYAGARLCLTFGELKPDHLVSCPFKAGPPKTKDGMPLGDAWSMSLEISDEQVKKYGELEAWLIKNVKKFKSALPQPKAKAGKSAKELTDEEFENKLNSLVQPANTEKGWKAKFRVAVQHTPIDANGNSRQMPSIHLTHQKNGQFTRPRKGTVNDLEKNSAVVVMCGLSRGVYIGNTGWGLKFQLVEAYVVSNMSSQNGPKIDLSNTIFLDEETPMSEDEVVKKPRIGSQSDDEQFAEQPSLLEMQAAAAM